MYWLASLQLLVFDELPLIAYHFSIFLWFSSTFQVKYHIIEINNGRKITSGQQDPIERGEKIEKRQKIEQDQQE
ncbi:hypothetical protein MJO28_000031 [Puccinia striiformis f. sp. tritici]|uniref:Uncharacterized protein n=1 Tax=Puccinia striiformis f. sp. tritici TaxID=168172 RepID=A0ACC0EWY5_9BASI|nr:hypothetical protein MJO28_000031 [Puccinia striiformis f. sp. tritici]